MQRPVGIALGAMFFAFLMARVAIPAGEADAFASESRAAQPTRSRAEIQRDPATTVLHRDASGQFFLTAQVNGQDVRFLIDTGADAVALTVATAEALNLDFNPESFEPISRTASGVGYGAVVQVDSIQLGEAEFNGVDAVVIDGLDTNLLGQAVLARLGRVELRGDTMVLHHD